jgi:hypothetical protein
MRRLSALELIELSEAGALLGPASRALLLLESSGAMARNVAEDLPLGMRERWLLAVRAAQFGPVMEMQQDCAGCDVQFEFRLTAADLGMDCLALPAEIPQRSVRCAESSVCVHAVTAGDLAAIEGLSDPDEARSVLRNRVAPGGDAIGEDEIDLILTELDPEAELAIAARCPDCGATQTVILDLAAFIWREIEFRIPRLLQQVADLANAFHWSERDILALPAARRRFYLTAAGL